MWGWLRRLSFDELPQLLNVLCGQMSLVGPRMITPEEGDKYGRLRMNLLTVKPGLTGLWQIRGRSDVSYNERVRIDMHYIRNYSVWLDLQILLQTIPVVIRGRGRIERPLWNGGKGWRPLRREHMELREYFSVIWKWLWLIVLATGIAAGASYYATSQQPKVYQASAKMLVGQSIQSPDPNSADISTSQQLAYTYIQIAKTRPVLQGAIDKLGLSMVPEQLDGMFDASIIQGTQLIELRVLDTDPTRAEALANELAHQLTLQGPASTEQDQSKRREFVQKQLDDLQTGIEEAQKTIVDLQDSIEVTASAREIADKQQQIATLQSQIGQWQQTYTGLLAFLAPRSPTISRLSNPLPFRGILLVPTLR